jgi:4-hydroxy-L-threonine phosphate dehydrogenase PdxA
MACAGIRYPGHTEILADYGGAQRVAMMLANDDIRTVLVTIHTSLRKAIEQADFEAHMCAIRLAHQGGKALGIAAPRVAVAGLNPHAGEGGTDHWSPQRPGRHDRGDRSKREGNHRTSRR